MSRNSLSLFVLIWTTMCRSDVTNYRCENGACNNGSSTGGWSTKIAAEDENFKFLQLKGSGLIHNDTLSTTQVDSRHDVMLEGTEFKLSNITDYSEFLHNGSDSTMDDVNSNAIGAAGIDQRARQDTFNVTSPRESPYSVLLLSDVIGEKTPIVCTGSLLTAEWVLSAAHCIFPIHSITSLNIYAGGYSFQEYHDKRPAVGSQTLTSKEFYVHPRYVGRHDFDISVIRAERKFKLTATVNTVKLSTQPWTYHSYHDCKFTGFGRVLLQTKSKEDFMRKTHSLMVKKPCLCSFRMKDMFGPLTVSQFICTKPKKDVGVCAGDSGSGLLCDGELRAVGSMILELGNVITCDLVVKRLECGSEDTFSIFGDTCPLIRWVNSHVELFNASEISPYCLVSAGDSAFIKYNLGILVALTQIQFCISHRLVNDI